MSANEPSIAALMNDQEIKKLLSLHFRKKNYELCPCQDHSKLATGEIPDQLPNLPAPSRFARKARPVSKPPPGPAYDSCPEIRQFVDFKSTNRYDEILESLMQPTNLDSQELS